MVTGAAIAVVQYSASVLFCAILIRLLLRPPALRAVATRVAVFFGVISVAAVYVWLELGPEVDARLAAETRMTLPPPVRTFAI